MRTIVDLARATACRLAMAARRSVWLGARLSVSGGPRGRRLDHIAGGLVRPAVLAASSVVVALTALLMASPALAETRTPADATAHALDELANCRAQRRPDMPFELTACQCMCQAGSFVSFEGF